jgi:HAD superfamily hydrolase (TIGR01509 family)
MSEPSSPVEILIFDFFGVIIEFDNDIVFGRLAPFCSDEADSFFRLNNLMADHDVITGRLPLPDLHASLVDRLGLTLSYEAFLAAWCEPYSHPMPGMADLIRRLSAHYRLILLSNIDLQYWNTIRPLHPELDCFEALLVSGELGLAKPGTAIFHHTVEVAAVSPNRCLFIDDTLHNIEAAAALGFQTHHFTSVEALKEDLVRRKLSF